MSAPERLPATTTKLNLANNNLGEIPALELAELRMLYLNGNNITAVGPAAFAGVPRLEHLNLGNNKISDVDRDAFQGLGDLARLFLFRNPHACDDLRARDVPAGDVCDCAAACRTCRGHGGSHCTSCRKPKSLTPQGKCEEPLPGGAGGRHDEL